MGVQSADPLKFFRLSSIRFNFAKTDRPGFAFCTKLRTINMKCCLLLLALAVVLGVSSGLSLKHDLRGGLVDRLQARKMGGPGGAKGGRGPADSADDDDDSAEKGGKGKGGKGKGGDDKEKQEYLQFQAMLAYGALASKCEMAALYVYGAAEEYNVTFEEAWEGAQPYMPTLYSACPKVKEFMDFYKDTDEDVQDMMVAAMAPYGLLMQCTNLFAELDTLRLMGFTNTTDDGTPESSVMVHGKPLIGGCIEVFGAAAAEADKVDEDLEKVEEVAPAPADNVSVKQLRGLLMHLEELLRSK